MHLAPERAKEWFARGFSVAPSGALNLLRTINPQLHCGLFSAAHPALCKFGGWRQKPALRLPEPSLFRREQGKVWAEQALVRFDQAKVRIQI